MPTLKTEINPTFTYAVWRRDEDHYYYMSGAELLELLSREDGYRIIAGWRYHDDRAPYY